VTKKRVGGNLKTVQPAAKGPKVKSYDDEFAKFSVCAIEGALQIVLSRRVVIWQFARTY
jgi:hypothetical protein